MRIANLSIFAVMRQSHKYIPTLVLWLAVFAMGAHTVVRHDHHAEISCAAQEERCPASESSQEHHSESPIHCHAFNDVASEKAVNYQYQSNVQCLDCPINQPFEGSAGVLSLWFSKIPEIIFPYRNPPVSSGTSLRGPPSFS